MWENSIKERCSTPANAEDRSFQSKRSLSVSSLCHFLDPSLSRRSRVARCEKRLGKEERSSISQCNQDELAETGAVKFFNLF